MDQAIIDMLKKEQQPDEIKKLKDHVVSLVKISRQAMSKKYKNWDKNQDIYSGIRPPDEEDEKANRDAEPEKMVVPLTYAQMILVGMRIMGIELARRELYRGI